MLPLRRFNLQIVQKHIYKKIIWNAVPNLSNTYDHD